MSLTGKTATELLALQAAGTNNTANTTGDPANRLTFT